MKDPHSKTFNPEIGVYLDLANFFGLDVIIVSQPRQWGEMFLFVNNDIVNWFLSLKDAVCLNIEIAQDYNTIRNLNKSDTFIQHF